MRTREAERIAITIQGQRCSSQRPMRPKKELKVMNNSPDYFLASSPMSSTMPFTERMDFVMMRYLPLTT